MKRVIIGLVSLIIMGNSGVLFSQQKNASLVRLKRAMDRQPVHLFLPIQEVSR